MSSPADTKHTPFRMIDLTLDQEAACEQAARILTAAFREHWPDAWPTLDDAREEVRAMCVPNRICRAALDEAGHVLGWIGGMEMGYDGRVWELHPLAVDPAQQGRGVGRALVADFETQVRSRGGSVVYLGTDDEDGMTTLAGAELWRDPWAHIQAIRDLKGHPFAFYQRLGYQVVGVLPDANGPGKPDIFMAKRLSVMSDE